MQEVNYLHLCTLKTPTKETLLNGEGGRGNLYASMCKGLIYKLKSLPKDVLSLIYSFDPTYREWFSRRVLLNTAFTLENRLFSNCIHTEYSQRKFYTMVSEMRCGSKGRMMSILNHLDLNNIYVEWFDYYETKYSMPYSHEITIIQNWKTPKMPFQKVILNYESEIGPPTLYFVIWNKCPLHLTDFVNAYIIQRDRKYNSHYFREIIRFGIANADNIRCKLIKDPYSDHGMEFNGWHQITEQVNSRKRKLRKCRKAHLSNISRYYDLTLFQENNGSIVAHLNLQEFLFNDIVILQTPNTERNKTMLNDVLNDMTQIWNYL